MLSYIRKYLPIALLLFVVASGSYIVDEARVRAEGILAAAAAAQEAALQPADTAQLGALTGSLYQASMPLQPGQAENAQAAPRPSAAAQLNVATQRASVMQTLAMTNPTAFIGYTLPDSVRAKLPAAVQDKVEQHKTLTGTVDVMHVDDFSDEHNDKFLYSLNVNGKQFKLTSAQDLPAMLSGTEVSVDGYQLGNDVVTIGGPAQFKIRTSPSPDSVGRQKILVILLKNPSSAAPLTKQEMQDYIFSGPFEQFYEEQSYGKVSFSGIVTDWINLDPYPSAPGCNPADIELDRPEIKQYLLARHIDMSKYDRVVFLSTDIADYGCSNIGKITTIFNANPYTLGVSWVAATLPLFPYKSFVDGTLLESRSVPQEYGTYLCQQVIKNHTGSTVQCTINGVAIYPFQDPLVGNLTRVLAHEMGHSLGVMHANAWQCDGPTLWDDCRDAEYGNVNDVMGQASNIGTAQQFNAFYKDILGWFGPRDKKVVTTSGTYSLAPLEATSGIRALIVSNPSLSSNFSGFGYLEYRQPIGFDSHLQPSSAGIFINYPIAPYQEGLYPGAVLLINPHQQAFPSFIYPALMSGESFQDIRYGFGINSVTLSPSKATLTISMQTPTCERHDLIQTFVYVYPETISAGSTAVLNAHLYNADFPACDASDYASNFSISDADSAWFLYQIPDNFSLPPGQEQYIWNTYYVPTDAPAGERTLTVTLNDTTHDRTYTIQKTITVTRPPESVALSSLSAATSAPGSTVTIAGSGFMLENTVHVGSASIDATTSVVSSLSFTVPQLSPGTYPVTVENGNGTSNSLNLTIPDTGTTTLSVGEQVQSTDKVIVRDGPAGVRLGVQKQGAHGTIAGNAVKKGKNNWWQVDWSTGVDGWVAESYLTTAQ